MRYKFIESQRATYPVRLLCSVMRVSASAYYAYASGTSYVLGAAKGGLGKQVEEGFLAHHRRYGSRRIVGELAAQGIEVGRFQVRSLMKRQGLQAIAPCRYVARTTDSKHTVEPSPNLLLDQENVPQQPRQVIVGDITYLPLQTGKWGYLASWQDKFSKRIVGWAVEERMTEELVIKAFEKAVASGSIECGTIVHTDCGSQYVSNNFRALLAANQCRQSMSRRANCWDNAQAESTFSRYKAELLEGGAFADISQARSETFSYIEGYYNRVRRHSSLGYKTPEEFEREYITKKKGESSESLVPGKT